MRAGAVKVPGGVFAADLGIAGEGMPLTRQVVVVVVVLVVVVVVVVLCVCVYMKTTS